MKKRRIRKGLAKVGKGIKNMKINKEKVKQGIRKIQAGKEKVKEGIVKAGRKVQLVKPILLVDGITLSNAMFGLLSIFASISGNLKVACYFLLLAAVMDVLDGKFARKLGRSSKLGKELDSLADIVSFGIAPAVLGFVYSECLFIIIPLVIFMACGIIRLAKFNVQLVKNAYFGMPITCNSIIFSVLYFTGAPPIHWYYVFIISAALMVSPFKIKKIL